MKTQLLQRREFIKLAGFSAASAAQAFFPGCQLTEDSGRPNILFIAVDDLRPQLGCYGHSQMISPNIDKLAASGTTFIRTYCQVPVCGASRASLLTGIRPTRIRFLNFSTWAERDYPEAVTLPQLFKQNGYHTISNGKIFHHLTDCRESWSEPPWRPDYATPTTQPNWRNYLTEENIKIAENHPRNAGRPFESARVADNAYFDGQTTEKTISDLRKLKQMNKPFFLAAGFLKPHLPFNAPKKY